MRQKYWMAFRLSIPYRDPLAAFASLADQPWSLMLYAGEQICICADPAQTLDWTAGVSDPLETLRQSLAVLGSEPIDSEASFGGGWAGLVGYEFGRHVLPCLDGGPVRKEWPDLALGLYDAVAVFEPGKRRAFILAHEWGGRRPDKLARGMKRKLEESVDEQSVLLPSASFESIVYPQPMDNSRKFCRQTKRVVEYIRAGDCLQANISHALPFNAPSGPYAVFAHLAERHPAQFCTYMRLPGPGGSVDALALVSNSPERFLKLRRQDGRLRVSSEPIKGTSPRHQDPALDQDLALELIASKKDRAENMMIVDLMRNDLARVSLPGSVVTEEICGLRRFPHQHHLVSRVGSVLAPGADATHLLAACFPGGSVTGAPKIRAMQIISEMEGVARGPYCGAFVRISCGGEMDSSILIRTAALTRRRSVWQGSFRVGSGIVADSSPEAEYRETLVKARALFGESYGRDTD